jgi:hypothetical protein
MATGFVMKEAEVQGIAAQFGPDSCAAKCLAKVADLKDRGFKAHIMMWPDAEQISLETDAPGERVTFNVKD